VSVGSIGVKAKKLSVVAGDIRKRLEFDALCHVRKLLRSCREPTVEDLFTKLSKDGQPIPVESLQRFLEDVPGASLQKVAYELAMKSFGEGLTRHSLAGIFEEYQTCVKDIALTSSFTVKGSKTVRKLEVGEIIEVLELAKLEEEMKADRVRCRALCDSIEGWVTLQGNHGTAFLETCSKPYYCCVEELALQTDMDSGSAEQRKLRPEEILEVLEGPRREPQIERVRLRGKDPQGKHNGWVTLKDNDGAYLEPIQLSVCQQAIALTRAFDITEGKAIRRLNVGDLIQLLGAPAMDEKRSLLRVKVRFVCDQKEGYITKEGNQGTCYIKEGPTAYVCQRPVPLEVGFYSGSKELTTLQAGEVFEVADGPETEVREGAMRLKARAAADGQIGWFTLSSKVKDWTPVSR